MKCILKRLPDFVTFLKKILKLIYKCNFTDLKRATEVLFKKKKKK